MRNGSEFFRPGNEAAAAFGGQQLEQQADIALVCRYCRCTPERACVLGKDALPTRGRGQPCSWHHMVELVADDGRTVVDYFCVCTNALCVRAYLGDPRAP